MAFVDEFSFPGLIVALLPIPIQTALYDAGARFNGKNQQVIPPPPPGYLPNAAQVAAMQGQTVSNTHTRTNLLDNYNNLVD